MKSCILRFFSIALTLALLINLLPAQIIGQELRDLLQTPSVIENDAIINESASITEEITTKRTRFSKEFKMSSGF